MTPKPHIPTDLLQAVFASLPDAVVVTDPDGTVRWANRAAERGLAGGAGVRVGDVFGLPAGDGPADADGDADAAGVGEMRVSRLHWDGRAHHVVVIRDITPHHRAEERARAMSLHDPLTGLANRTLLFDRLEHLLAARWRDPDAPAFALMFLDLDRFKDVNDTYGHTTADGLLTAFADRVRRRIRPADTFARVGGDEFAILLPDTRDAAACAHAAVRILTTLQEPFEVGGRTIQVRTSIGVSIASARVSAPQEILAEADAALYRAKERGRGTYRIYDAELHAESERRLALEADLRRAAARGEVLTARETLVDLATGRPRGVQVASRWRLPERHDPVEADRMTRDLKLAAALDVWSVQHGLDLAAGAGDGTLVVVDVSPRILEDRSAVEELHDALRRAPGRAGRLRVHVQRPRMAEEDARVAIRRLADIGVPVWVGLEAGDGGYWPLRRLARTGVAGLSLDARAIAGEDREVLSAVLRLAASMRLEMHARGVDSEELRAQARDAGIATGQGLLFVGAGLLDPPAAAR